MNSAYWDDVAEDYEREVLSVFDHDTAGLVRTRIRDGGARATHGTAADLGCGVGKFTRLLAEAFLRVHACDRSARGIAATRTACREQDNVDFWCLDLTHDPVPFAPVGFVLCVNVLIMPCLDERLRAWRTVTNQVTQNGTLLLVVPSLESVQWGYYAALESALRAGNSCAESLRRSVPDHGAVADLHHGVHLLDGLRTKHYLREELEHMLPAHEFDLTELLKIEYAHDADSSVSSWDWLVVARRR